MDEIKNLEGKKPFNFSFFDPDGKKYELDEILGKKNIVIYFYPKDFTPGCTIQAGEFTEIYEKYRENEIEIIGISPDSDESHIKFREKMNIPYMLASDKDNLISKKYGVYGLKKFMGKEYYGVNRSTFLIDKKGKITKTFEKVKPAGHSKEVLEYFIK
jgi:thioredoxin-dependent peroxiredoxin